MMNARAALSAVVVAGLLLSAPSSSYAQVQFGGQVNVGTETDFGIGGRIVANMHEVSGGLGFIGSFDIYFPDGPRDYFEMNGNLIYTIDLKETTNAPYVGGGLNVGHASNGGSGTELGLNLLGGIKFPLPGVTLFFELRGTILTDIAEQVVFTGGFLIP